MSIPPDSYGRGCASSYCQPLEEDDELETQFWEAILLLHNCDDTPTPLPGIAYRSSTGDKDIIRHVFRWDRTPYEEVFENGFKARLQADTRDTVYCSLDHYVHHGGRPLDSRRETTHIFISTTLSSGWYPSVDPETKDVVYRYEIYAPGGIWVAQTLREHYRYPAQDEVTFVAGIAPQYIRSAQAFKLSAPAGSRFCSRFTTRSRVDNVLRINGKFNPQSHPFRKLKIQRPISVYSDPETRRKIELTAITYPPQEPAPQASELKKQKKRKKPKASTTDWYAVDVANCVGYIDAAIRSPRTNEAYLFMKDEYVLFNYAPGSTTNRVVDGPAPICEGYSSLAGTAFAEHGIDCAFGRSLDEAFIFSGNLCAQINYAPGTDDKIINGPMTITDMFHFFKGTVFESGVDAAFESMKRDEAYLFKGNQNALIYYGSDDPQLIAIRPITEGFASLKDTIFESGIDAAFASHRSNEAYLFKGDSYALIKFAPGDTADDYIIGGVKKILLDWSSLDGILPHKNSGLDVHDHTQPLPHRDQDEL